MEAGGGPGADNSEAFLMEVKSTAYGDLDSKAFLRDLVAVMQLVHRSVAPVCVRQPFPQNRVHPAPTNLLPIQAPPVMSSTSGVYF